MWCSGDPGQSPVASCVLEFQGLRVLGQINEVNVEISVLLGRSTLPMQQLLRMGRGAVIPLDAGVNEEVWILANNHPVARGEIQINEDRISIAVTRAADVYDFMAGGQ
ncbi:FliM/FliN family flagellar motor switch protein [Phenylobacterium sp.]|uniref:FliM/FliN family flagellar motor switch protein n=1 Tax=Phenylobacterium sp. TaxID=1871053 RepID=UPI0035ADF9A6